MTDNRVSSRSTFRTLALALSYALCVALGAGARLVLDHRALDPRMMTALLIIGAGCVLAMPLILLCERNYSAWPSPARAAMTCVLTLVFSLFTQALVHGIYFYGTAVIEHEPFGTADWALQLAFTTAHGMAYFLIFGLRLDMPVMLIAALLFALGSLTLQASTRSHLSSPHRGEDQGEGR